VPSHQSRGGWHSLIPPKVAPFYAAANTPALTVVRPRAAW
jgi:hypothetical protein